MSESLCLSRSRSAAAARVVGAVHEVPRVLEVVGRRGERGHDDERRGVLPDLRQAGQHPLGAAPVVDGLGHVHGDGTVAGQVRWTFGRDLLIGGLYEPTGDGDVHVWPCLDNEAHSVIIIELCSPDGEALVQARSADMTTFVERMTAAVAPGAEAAQLDVDGAIAAIFAAEAA